MMERHEMAEAAGAKLARYRVSTPHPTEHRGLYQTDVVDGSPRGMNQKRLSDIECGRCAHLVSREIVRHLAESYGRSEDEIFELVVLTYTPEAEQRLVQLQDQAYQLDVLERAVKRFADEEAAA